MRYSTRVVVGLTLAALAQTGSAERLDHVDSIHPASAHADAIAAAREHMQTLLAGGAPGVSIAVGIDGRLVWAEGFGFANIEHRVPVTPLTKFRIGSVSKPMATVAMGVLYDAGKLDLDSPVQRYVPSFPEKAKGPVTARQLASHRSGIRHYLPDLSDNLVTKHYDDVVDGLEVFSADPLAHAPEAQFLYSSHGFNLLSAVIQGAAGRDFLSVMRDSVWAPLGLLHTLADHTDHMIEHRAAPYTRGAGGKLRNAPYVDNSYKWAGGGFLSTPSDLVRFGFGVLHDGIVTPETWQMLLTPPTLANGEQADQNYGLGWFIYDEGWIGHGGGSVGGNTLFQIHPEQDVVVAIACNLSGCLRVNPDLNQLPALFLD